MHVVDTSHTRRVVDTTQRKPMCSCLVRSCTSLLSLMTGVKRAPFSRNIGHLMRLQQSHKEIDQHWTNLQSLTRLSWSKHGISCHPTDRLPSILLEALMNYAFHPGDETGPGMSITKRLRRGREDRSSILHVEKSVAVRSATSGSAMYVQDFIHPVVIIQATDLVEDSTRRLESLNTIDLEVVNLVRETLKRILDM